MPLAVCSSVTTTDIKEPANDPSSANAITRPACVASIIREHSYATTVSPRAMKRKVTAAVDRALTLQKKLKSSHRRVSRLKKRCQSLSEVIKDLKKNDMISSNCEEMLQQAFSELPLEVMKRILQQKSSVPTRASYPDELKSFALTLSFYSIKAYNYVRKTFQLALPHPSTLRTWYRAMNGQPGFTEEAFAALSIRVEEERKEQRQVVCALVFDELAIRKHVEWDGKKFAGYVDVGAGVESDSVPVASEALVLMLVAMNSNWKIPCGYFFIAGMSGEERANMIKQCLLKLHDTGVLVSSITCDGPSCNFAMMDALGVKLDPQNITSYFPHPADATIHVNVVLDACHMLKLVRNCWASYGIIKDKNGGKINWQYVEQLHKLQESEGLRLANKLKAAHVHWQKAKMKVSLAAQTLSASVADALEFCNEELKLPQFSGCQPTVHFLRTIDRLFDLLNSRNPLAKGYKSPLKPSNFRYWRPFLDEAKSYLIGLTDYHGTPMYKTKRKTAFIGLLCTIDSVIDIYNTFVATVNAPLKYLLTYKISQDHIEWFFGAIRASLGSNNNPTVRQFTAAYKRLLMRHNVQGGLGNCTVLDNTTLLPASSIAGSDSYNVSVYRLYDLKCREPLESDHDYAVVPNVCDLSQYKQAAVAYIAGYVVRMVRKRTACLQSQSALISPNTDPAVVVNTGTVFVKFKDHGGLVHPSHSVIVVCQETEKCFNRMKAVLGDSLPQASKLPTVISNAVLAEVGSKTFTNLDCHMFDSTADSNHIFVLIKLIVACYTKIRMHHLAKQKTAEITGISVRKQFSKLILFKHQ